MTEQEALDRMDPNWALIKALFAKVEHLEDSLGAACERIIELEKGVAYVPGITVDTACDVKQSIPFTAEAKAAWAERLQSKRHSVQR
jgi:hypothetical protein